MLSAVSLSESLPFPGEAPRGHWSPGTELGEKEIVLIWVSQTTCHGRCAVLDPCLWSVIEMKKSTVFHFLARLTTSRFAHCGLKQLLVLLLHLCWGHLVVGVLGVELFKQWLCPAMVGCIGGVVGVGQNNVGTCILSMFQELA